MSTRHHRAAKASAATEARRRELAQFVAAVEHAVRMETALEAVFIAISPWPEAHAAATRALTAICRAG